MVFCPGPEDLVVVGLQRFGVVLSYQTAIPAVGVRSSILFARKSVISQIAGICTTVPYYGHKSLLEEEVPLDPWLRYASPRPEERPGVDLARVGHPGTLLT